MRMSTSKRTRTDGSFGLLPVSDAPSLSVVRSGSGVSVADDPLAGLYHKTTPACPAWRKATAFGLRLEWCGGVCFDGLRSPEDAQAARFWMFLSLQAPFAGA
jgi:hypothetical protein